MAQKIKEVKEAETLPFHEYLSMDQAKEMLNHPKARKYSLIRFYYFKDDTSNYCVESKLLNKSTTSQENLREILKYIGNGFCDNVI